MAMLMTPMNIAKMDKMAILAIMATIVIAIAKFSVAKKGIQEKSKKKN